MAEIDAPYVVTDDLEIVFPHLQCQGIIPPDRNEVREASQRIVESLNRIFPALEVIHSSRISDFLNRSVLLSNMPAISLTGLLDDKLATASLHFSRSVRAVSRQLPQFSYTPIGVMPRTSSDLSCAMQFDCAANSIRPTSKNIVLIDDVIFSGGTVGTIFDEFRKRALCVEKVVASVAIEGAIKKLAARGVSVEADIVYPNVQDEVCMRDFVVGAPEGGRNVISQEGYYEAAPYILPFGDVEGWATIPSGNCVEFSRVAIEASLDLWKKIDKRNGRNILVKELAKPIIGLNMNASIVTQLEYKLECLG